jgi:hypothetical protein
MRMVEPEVSSRSVGLEKWSYRLAAAVAMTGLAIILGGCGSGSSTSSYTPSPKTALSGVVYGGTVGNPISGAQVVLYGMGNSGYGAGALQLATATTDHDGHFKFKKPACQSGQQLYLVATGGTPAGQSAPNTAIALSAAIGPCGANEPSVTINEVTTVATVWALNQFTDSTGQNIGTAASNQTGLANSVAMLTASSLADLKTGLAPDLLPLGVYPTSDALYTLADILATCVDSSGAGSSECQDLFDDATPPSGPAPATILEAAVAMVRNPSNNVSALYSLISSNPPFNPYLVSPPESWVLAIDYDPAGAELNGPYALAIDAAGNVWIADAGGNSASVIYAATGYITGSAYSPSGAEISFPGGIAVDLQGNVWIANFTGQSVSELTEASGYSTGLNFAPPGASFSGPFELALDVAGNVWVGNFTGASVSELTAASSYSTGLNFAPVDAGITDPVTITIDPQNNVWVGNYTGQSVSELTAASNYASGSSYAPAAAAFSNPISLGFDSTGNLWVANQNVSSVSELLAGNFTTGFNIIPAGAALSAPTGLAVDSADNLWISNVLGNNLSEITSASAYSTGISFNPSTGNVRCAVDFE